MFYKIWEKFTKLFIYFFDFELITKAQGKPFITSAAKDGPEINPIFSSGTNDE